MGQDGSKRSSRQWIVDDIDVETGEPSREALAQAMLEAEAILSRVGGALTVLAVRERVSDDPAVPRIFRGFMFEWSSFVPDVRRRDALDVADIPSIGYDEETAVGEQPRSDELSDEEMAQHFPPLEDDVVDAGVVEDDRAAEIDAELEAAAAAGQAAATVEPAEQPTGA